MMLPVSASRPASAIIPTHTATLRLYWSSHSSHTAPTSENGTASITIAVSVTERRLKNSSPNTISSVTGITSASRARPPARQHLRVVAQLARVAPAHGVALAALHGLGHRQAADRRLDHVLDVAHREPVARRVGAADVEVQEAPAGDAVREHAARPGHR